MCCECSSTVFKTYTTSNWEIVESGEVCVYIEKSYASCMHSLYYVKILFNNNGLYRLSLSLSSRACFIWGCCGLGHFQKIRVLLPQQFFNGFKWWSLVVIKWPVRSIWIEWQNERLFCTYSSSGTTWHRFVWNTILPAHHHDPVHFQGASRWGRLDVVHLLLEGTDNL